MSNTKFIVYNPNTSSYHDLSQVFLPLSSGTQSLTTTDFTVNGTDLNEIFASINSQSEFNTTSSLLTTSNGSNKSDTTLASNFYIPSNYSYFNFILYGGGGSASQAGSSTYGTGGGGAGSYIEAINIPYSSDDGTIQEIRYSISGGQSPGSAFATTVKVTYSNGKYFILSAGSGQSTSINSGQTGASGGSASYENTTTINSIITINKLENGTSGGHQGSNGTSNNYTSSGSGNDGGASAPVGNPPLATQTYNTTDGKSYTIVSHGGGKTQNVYQYGAGGAATPANYHGGVYSPGEIRYGVAGCILYWLSS